MQAIDICSYICPITLQPMYDAIVDNRGHSFSEEGIREWLSRNNHTCPIGGETLTLADIRANFAVRQILEEFRLQIDAQVARENSQVRVISLLVGNQIKTPKDLNTFVENSNRHILREFILKIMSEYSATFNDIRDEVDRIRHSSEISLEATIRFNMELDRFEQEKQAECLKAQAKQLRLSRVETAEANERARQANEIANIAIAETEQVIAQNLIARAQDQARIEQLERGNLERDRQIRELKMETNSSNAMIAGAKIAGTLAAGVYLGGIITAGATAGYVMGALGGATAIAFEEIENKKANQDTWIEKVKGKPFVVVIQEN